MDARELLDITAEYVRAVDSVDLGRAMGAKNTADLDEIAERWTAALDAYINARSVR